MSDTGYECFDFLVKNGNDGRRSVEGEYEFTTEDFSKFVVSSGHKYRVYKNARSFIRHLESMPEVSRTFHEIVIGPKQKLKLDIDAALVGVEILARKEGLTPGEMFETIFEKILAVVKDVFYVTYTKDLEDHNLVICDSSDPAVKFSRHIIVDGWYVSDAAQSKHFLTEVDKYLPFEICQFLDKSTSKPNQSFRIAGCRKLEDQRYKRIVSGHTILQSVVGYVDECEKLDDVKAAGGGVADRKGEDMGSEDEAAALKMCREAGLLEAHVFRKSIGTLMVFDRVEPSFCDICGRTHDNDNTLMVMNVRRGVNVEVRMQCRRTAGKFLVVGSFVSSDISGSDIAKVEVESWMSKKLKAEVERAQNVTVSETLFDRLPDENKCVYSAKSIQKLELKRTLVVHAAMKMGKTKALRQYIDEHFGRGAVVRFLSFRQTFSGKIKGSFEDFRLYSDEKGQLRHDRLIIQLESLYRLAIEPGSEPPDLLVLDECESIFEQFGSGLHKSFGETNSKFSYLMRYSKHVVCMDACVSNRTYRILQNIRGDVDVFYHRNVYKNATDDRYYFTCNFNGWLDKLYLKVEENEKLVVVMNSAGKAKVLKSVLESKYPDRCVKLYSAETLQSEKKADFKAVDTVWVDFDILVYTPTISAGVSFEVKHFDTLFGYFTDKSCTVETCLQMMGRVRDIGSGEYYICLRGSGNSLATDVKSVEEVVYRGRGSLFESFDEIGVRAEYNGNGNLRYYSSDYFHIWIENTIIGNKSKNSFISRFVGSVAENGANVSSWEHECEDEEAVGIEYAQSREVVSEKGAAAIAKAEDITEGEAEEIKRKMSSQEDISEKERSEILKYNLRRDYGGYAAPLTVSFVRKYYSPGLRKIYRNLVKLYSYGNISEFLTKLQEEEREYYLWNANLGEKFEWMDINHRYVFNRHRCALSLLVLMGWKTAEDGVFNFRGTVVDNLQKNKALFLRTLKEICAELEINCKVYANSEFDILVGMANKVLGMMYGMRVSYIRAQKDMMFLTTCGSFWISGQPDSEGKRKVNLNI